MALINAIGAGSATHTSSSGSTHGGHGGSFGSPVSKSIPVNSSTPSSASGVYYNGFGGNYMDVLRAIADQNNAFNVAQTEYVNAFNAREAQKQRDWLERMSNTAHQREIEDLKKSGLNPVLSALNGNGAAVGNASSASGQKAVADNILGNGVISMLAAMINASSAASVASIYANASMYTANKHLEGTKYSADTSSATAKSRLNFDKFNAIVGKLLPFIS